MIAHRQESCLYPGGVLPTIKGTEKRLRKLERLDTVDKQKNPATGVNHYGITKNGIAAAWSFGHDMEPRFQDQLPLLRAAESLPHHRSCSGPARLS